MHNKMRTSNHIHVNKKPFVFFGWEEICFFHLSYILYIHPDVKWIHMQLWFLSLTSPTVLLLCCPPLLHRICLNENEIAHGMLCTSSLCSSSKVYFIGSRIEPVDMQLWRRTCRAHNPKIIIYPHKSSNSFATSGQEIPADLLEALDESDMMFWSVSLCGRRTGHRFVERYRLRGTIDVGTQRNSDCRNITFLYNIFIFLRYRKDILYQYRYAKDGLLMFVDLFCLSFKNTNSFKDLV